MHHRIRTRAFWLIAVLAIGFLLAACGDAAQPPAAEPAAATEAPTEVPTEAPAEEAAPTEDPAEESASSALEGVTWQVAEFIAADGSTSAPVADATLTFANGQVTGNAGCNGFFAGYTLDGSALTIDQGGSTMMACEEPVMAQEGALLAAMGQVASYTAADDHSLPQLCGWLQYAGSNDLGRLGAATLSAPTGSFAL